MLFVWCTFLDGATAAESSLISQHLDKTHSPAVTCVASRAIKSIQQNCSGGDNQRKQSAESTVESEIWFDAVSEFGSVCQREQPRADGVISINQVKQECS